MKNILVILGLFLSVPAIAEEVTEVETEDVAAVSERVSCSDINAQIKELSEIEEPDEVALDELAELKSQYRRNCTKSVSGRRTSGRGAVMLMETPSESDVAQQEAEESVEVVESEQSESEQPVDALSPQQEQANLDAGLCADGSQPNKFGCCAGEKFKDIGNLNFACCNDLECFPPIK